MDEQYWPEDCCRKPPRPNETQIVSKKPPPPWKKHPNGAVKRTRLDTCQVQLRFVEWALTSGLWCPQVHVRCGRLILRARKSDLLLEDPKRTFSPLQRKKKVKMWRCSCTPTCLFHPSNGCGFLLSWRSSTALTLGFPSMQEVASLDMFERPLCACLNLLAPLKFERFCNQSWMPVLRMIVVKYWSVTGKCKKIRYPSSALRIQATLRLIEQKHIYDQNMCGFYLCLCTVAGHEDMQTCLKHTELGFENKFRSSFPARIVGQLTRTAFEPLQIGGKFCILYLIHEDVVLLSKLMYCGSPAWRKEVAW